MHNLKNYTGLYVHKFVSGRADPMFTTLTAWSFAFLTAGRLISARPCGGGVGPTSQGHHVYDEKESYFIELDLVFFISQEISTAFTRGTKKNSLRGKKGASWIPIINPKGLFITDEHKSLTQNPIFRLKKVCPNSAMHPNILIFCYK